MVTKRVMTTATDATATDFPIHWAAPEDEQLFWFQDSMHSPHALAPLDATLTLPSYIEGATNAIAKLSMPISGARSATFNGYTYLAPVPVIGTPEEMDARFQEMIRITMELGATVLQDWRETFEPRVLAECDEVLGFDYGAASTPALAAFVAGFHERLVRVWDIHMRVNIPPMNAVFGLEDFLGAVLGEEAVSQSRQLLQGFDNKSVALGKAFWDLSRWVRESPSLAKAVAGATTEGGILAVVGDPLAAEFLKRWQAFLDVYGWRANRFIELSSPSWREDQSTPFLQLKGFLSKPDSGDPYEGHRRQAADRDRLAGELAAKLPPEAAGQFHGMLGIAQQYIPIAEDHNFTIDQKTTTVLRHGVLQLGKRLVSEGSLAGTEDVFYLTFEEIRGIAAGGDRGGFKGSVVARRAEQARQELLTPLPAVGTPPPADMPPDPLVSKFFGLGMEPSRDGQTIKGIPCSGGTVTGVARVLLSLDDADKLGEGEIMVCRSTMPAWTPLFGVAGGVVADAGGPLSHCAIVAREYEIPCVGGTQNGTRMIKDGMRLRVDGTKGTVEILD